ncbi:MAG: hypothetical protein IPJ98_20330 [Bryobacterales bacterium]|nr:hypothetical protein [Bryobacterales bacterium]
MRLRRGLEAGKWLLAHGQFLFCWQEVGRLLNDGAALPATALSEAASEACARLRESADERGTMIVPRGQGGLVRAWTRSGTRTAALFLPTAALLTPHQSDRRFRIGLLDTEAKRSPGGPAPQHGRPSA